MKQVTLAVSRPRRTVHLTPSAHRHANKALCRQPPPWPFALGSLNRAAIRDQLTEFDFARGLLKGADGSVCSRRIDGLRQACGVAQPACRRA
jgi:hypothetical protein